MHRFLYRAAFPINKPLPVNPVGALFCAVINHKTILEPPLMDSTTITVRCLLFQNIRYDDIAGINKGEDVAHHDIVDING